MSAHWIIDETQDPVSCRAHMKIAVYEKPPYPERGYDQYHGSGGLDAVRKQCRWWNAQRERVRLHNGRSAVVTFEIDTRATNTRESSILSALLDARHPLFPDEEVIPHHRLDAVANMRRAGQTSERGLNYVYAGMLGAEKTLINCLVMYAVDSIERDGMDHPGRDYAYHIFAHEAGHLLGLGEAYVRGPRGRPSDRSIRTATSESGQSWRTTSFPGYERNVMGDVIKDIDHRDPTRQRTPPPQGRAWLGWTQARDMAIRAYEVYYGVVGAYGEGSTLVRERGMPDYTVEMRSTSAVSPGRRWWSDWMPF